MEGIGFIKEQEVSEFNSSLLAIQRLHNLWLDINKFSQRGNFQQWNYCLDVILRELSWDLIKSDKENNSNFKEQLEEIEASINTINKTPNSNSKKSILYSILNKKEILLRQIQENSGKGSRYKLADSEDMS